MKKLLLATAVVFAASQASAAVINVTLEGTQTQVSPFDGSDLGGGVSTATGGTYNTETGVLSFDFVTTEQKANVFGTIVPLTLTGDLNVNFTAKNGVNNVKTCVGNGQACFFAKGVQNFADKSGVSTLTGGPADIANPFASGNTFDFGGMVYNSQAVVTLKYTVTAASPTSEVPVPAAAWLFGSALAGLAGLRKRK